MPIGKHYDLDTDVTLANNSDNTIASQKATKAYIDNNYIPASAMEEAATVAKTGDYNDLINKPTIDSELSTTSTNAAQNKIITTELNKKIQQNDVLQNLNNHNSSDRTKIWLSSLDNTLYRANKRFTVTLTNFDTTDSTNLFDMNWDSDVRISSGKTGTINITGGTNLGMQYPYGYIYISFYGGNSPTNISQISGRMYQDWSGHNTGWVNLSSFTAISKGTYGGVEHIKVARVSVGTYGIQQIEINIDNTDGVGYENSKIWVTQVEFFCNRTGIGSLPVLTKRGGDTIYGNLTIPTDNGSFIGNLTGTATQATKDGSGNTITSTYVPNTRKVNNKALSSDITLTASDVGAISSHQSIKTLNTNNTTAQTASASEAIAGSGSISLHKVSKTGSYNDLLNKPTIPTVNDATLTIQQNGTTVTTFSANASSAATANIATTVVKFRDWSAS